MAVPLCSLRGADDLGTRGILDLIPFIDWMDRWHQRVLADDQRSGPGLAWRIRTADSEAGPL